MLADGAGNVIKTYTYDAFGVETNKDEADTNPFRYAGEYYDGETDSIYLRARYYAPRTGRFTTEDPIRDGLNWYSYCGGNPVMLVDPSGLIDVMLKYAIEKVGGSVSFNEETGRAIAYFDGKTVEYSGEIINGRMIIDSAILANNFKLTESYLLHNAEDEFVSADDAAMAFGLMYNRISCLPNGVESQAYIYENDNGKFIFADVTAGEDLGNGFRTVDAPLPDSDRNLVAWAHTHGPYPDINHPDIALDLFTGRNEFFDEEGNLIQTLGDGSYSYSLEAGSYVFTPGGYFKYLDYTQWTENVTIWISNNDPAVRTISTKFPTK